MTFRTLAVGVVLTLLLSLQATAVDTLFPAIPALRADLAIHAGGAQLSISAFVYAFAATQLVYGPLSDRYGRRPVLLWAMGLFTLGSVLSAAAGSFEALVASRVLQGLGAGAAPAIARAVVRDIYGPTRSGQVLSYIMAGFGVVAVCNPVLGGLLTDWWGWRAVFAYIAASGAVIMLLVWLGLAETLPAREGEGFGLRRLPRTYRALLSDRRFVSVTACTCCMHGAMFAWLSGAVLAFIEGYGATASLAGLFISISIAGFILGSAIAGRIAGRLGGARLILTGNLICLVSTAAAVVLAIAAMSPPLMVAPVFVFMFGIGFVIPPGSAAAIAPFPSMAGAASSLVGFGQISTSSTVILVGGYLYDGAMLPVALAMTGLAGAGLLVFALGYLPAVQPASKR